MVVSTWKKRSHLVQGLPSNDLCLRIVGSARDGQLVRISAAKCTIGSAEGCTLRLRAGGVRPLHCLVLRGSQGTVARCWARHAWLNGRPFRDAPLSPGDRLRIGPVELEVLPVSPTEQAPRGQGNREGGLWQVNVDGMQAELDARGSELADQLAQLEAARFAFEHDRRQWEQHCASARLSREEYDETAHQEEACHHAQARLDLLRTELEARSADLEAREAHLVQQEARLDQQAQALQGAVEQLEAARRALEAEHHVRDCTGGPNQ